MTHPGYLCSQSTEIGIFKAVTQYYFAKLTHAAISFSKGYFKWGKFLLQFTLQGVGQGQPSACHQKPWAAPSPASLVNSYVIVSRRPQWGGLVGWWYLAVPGWECSWPHSKSLFQLPHQIKCCVGLSLQGEILRFQLLAIVAEQICTLWGERQWVVSEAKVCFGWTGCCHTYTLSTWVPKCLPELERRRGTIGEKGFSFGAKGTTPS